MESSTTPQIVELDPLDYRATGVTLDSGERGWAISGMSLDENGLVLHVNVSHPDDPWQVQRWNVSVAIDRSGESLLVGTPQLSLEAAPDA